MTDLGKIAPWGPELEQLPPILKRLSLSQEQPPVLALATVIATWGSSPRAVGSHMLVGPDQQFCGSVSGGCIEGEVIRNALEVITEGNPRVLRFQVTNDQAWEVGLSCGGTIEVLVEAIDAQHTLALAVASKQPATDIWRLASLTGSASWLFENRQQAHRCGCPATLLAEIDKAMVNGVSHKFDEGYFLQRYQAPARLYIVGAVHTAQHLAIMAQRCGLAPVIIDPRRSFASPERFPDLCLIQQWPDQVLQANPLGHASALVTLSHDPKIDDPALCKALDSEAFYIGALGSRKTHSERLLRLGALGYDAELERINAPVGLDLGGRAPAEIAVSILAQVIQARYRGGRHATP